MTWHRDPSRLDRAYDRINGWFDRRDGRAPAPFPKRTEPDRGSRAFEIDFNVVKAGMTGPDGLRLSWALEVHGERHILEVRPHAKRLEVRLDDTAFSQIARPTGKTPYLESPSRIEESDLVVIAEWRQMSDEHLWIAVCIDGVSAADGRALDEIRSERPEPVGRYDSLMWRFPWGLLADVGCQGALLTLALLPALIPMGLANAALLRHREIGAGRWLLITIVSFAALAAYLTVLAVLLLLVGALVSR